MVGAMKLTEQIKVGDTQQTAYYDITTYHVPYRGTFDAGRIHRVLNDRFGAGRGIWGSAVGGYCSAENIRDLGNGVFAYDKYYHIGD